MVAGFGLFAVGSALSITHGIAQLRSNDPGDDYGLAYGVLALSFILEGISFLQVRRQSTVTARRFRVSRWRHIADTSDTTVRSVFLEDLSALIGIVIAAGGLLAHELTGRAVYDAVGSILVGVLLGLVSLFLIRRNAEFLVGEPGSARLRAQISEQLSADPEIERVTFLHLEYVGAAKILVVAAVDLVGDSVESVLARRLHEIEQRIGQNEYVERCLLTLSEPSTPSKPAKPAKGQSSG